jgi:glycerol-3-phosphate dehydrogenase
MMQRAQMIDRLNAPNVRWDMLVVGGGASGLGVAVEAASRGYRTLLLEALDFAQGTSSRSTKLIHGGVRYLQQGNVALVLDALHERGLLLQNAPHLVRHQSFIVPNYEWWEGPFYGVGMKIYDALAGKLGLAPSRWLSREETLAHIPTLEPDRLRGGVMYYDGQFDDARLAVVLAQTLADLGGVPLNYMPVTELIKHGDLVQGAVARDVESGQEVRIQARVVVNATGAFVDRVRRLDDPAAETIIAPSQGIHLVLSADFLPGDSAIMVPHTDDGRVLFAVPWQGRVIVGTTETPLAEAVIEPLPLAEEVDFLLRHAARYLTQDPGPADVLSLFAGIRPLVHNAGHGGSTASLARDHHVLVSPSGLVTLAGGKWTTYRKMGEDAVNQAEIVAGLGHRPTHTRHLNLHGWAAAVDDDPRLAPYGRDAAGLRELMATEPQLDRPLHPRLPYSHAQLAWAVRHEMARSLEDLLARRTRALILDARASLEAAPAAADCLARELGRDPAWAQQQVAAYRHLARGYLPGGLSD